MHDSKAGANETGTGAAKVIPEMEQVRSFIAIELPDEVKSGLDDLQARLKTGQPPSMKWVNPNSIHLTLKFLGDVATDQINGITKVMAAAARGIVPFPLEVRKLGVFPNPRRVQVVWVRVGGDLAQLSQLQRRIESNLVPLGYTPEVRKFIPHLTLARLREQATPDERESLGQLIAGTGFTATPSFTVDAVNLIKSQLTREGAIYHQISSVELEKSLSTTTE